MDVVGGRAGCRYSVNLQPGGNILLTEPMKLSVLATISVHANSSSHRFRIPAIHLKG